MNKRNGLIKNTVILFTAMILTKIIGAVLKIPLANILGGIGMGYFSTAYSLFSPVYAVLAAGLPTVITRLTARNVSEGKFHTVRKIRRTALILSTAGGIAGSVFILLAADPFSRYLSSSYDSRFAIAAIAPSVFFCCIAAVYKGYYEGLSNMMPTAVSQVVESTVKAVLGLGLSYLVISAMEREGKSMDSILPYAASAAVLGVTIGEICGTLFLFLRDKVLGDGISPEELTASPASPGTRAVLRKLVRETVPISIGAVAADLSSFIDLLTIPAGIGLCAARNGEYFASHFPEAIGSAASGEFGTFVYGSYTGIVLSLFMLISSTTALMGKSALPGIACAWELEKKDELCHNIRVLFSGVFVIGLPLYLSLGALAKPVLCLLYPSRTAEISVCVLPLMILCFGGITVSVTGGLFAVFQAIGRADITIKLTIMCAVLKLISNLLLMRVPQVSIVAPAISSVMSHIAVCAVGTVVLRRLTSIAPWRGVFIKPFISAALCCISACAAYYFLANNYSPLLRLVISAVAGLAVYFVMLLVFDKRLFRRRT